MSAELITHPLWDLSDLRLARLGSDDIFRQEYQQRLARLCERYDSDLIEKLVPSIDLSIAAHEGFHGPGGRPLALHCVDVALALPLESPSLEHIQLSLLHDAATPKYSKFSQQEFIEKALAAGCSDRVIAAALCFARPTDGWKYDDWISFLMHDDLTRLTKIADSDAAIEGFTPESDAQLAAWKHTRKRLAENAPEPPEVSARIERAQNVHPLPDLRYVGTMQAA